MQPIRVLAPDVVDKIAAGEVLDRPANLVKELVENSLDAGASEIEIEFDQGGREVLVRDNGRGIPKASLALALQRHATSKISLSEDLFHLHSFGFRGEALASVAAVSRLALTSRTEGDAQAYRLDAEFGAIGNDVVKIAAPQGTELRVRELFANVPARLRFLKSEAAEHGQIKTTLKALALAHEEVGFRVRSRGELLFSWSKGAPFLERAKAVLGVTSLYEGVFEGADGVRVHVLVSSPQDTHQVNRNLWFFVQGRWVQDRSLTAAVMEAYRNLLMHGEYPTVIARVTMRPEDVDVNVHPTKAQVKFRDGQNVFRAVHKAVREVLEKAPWLGANQPSSCPSQHDKVAVEPTAMNLKFHAPEFERTQYSQKVFPLAEVREAVAAYSPAPTLKPAPGVTAIEPQPSSQPQFRWEDLSVIGQLHQTYIVAQSDESMFLVDQHAAHERVMFERLMASFCLGKMDVQNLLLPLVFDFTAEEVEVLHAHRESIEKMGLSLERMGPESVAVQAIPSLVGESSVAEALRKLAHELVQHSGSFALEKVVGDLFATMACHSVVRAGQTLSVEQMKSLLVQMDEFPLSCFCPHGRPVSIRRTIQDLEREFGRVL